MTIEHELFYPAVIELDEHMVEESFEEHALGELALKRLVDVGVAMREPSQLGKLARLITVSSARSRVRRLRAASKPGLSLRSVTCDLKLSSSYWNPMVKHEPELHSKGCLQIAHSRSRQDDRQLPKPSETDSD